MKKNLCLILAFVIMLGMVGCGSSAKKPEPKAKEQLSENEALLYEALIQITKADFYEPSAIKVLEIGDFHNVESGPATIVVRLQGENRVGGTLNHYYKICIIAGEDQSEGGQFIIGANELLIKIAAADSRMEDVREYQIVLIDYKADFADYAELNEDYKIITDESSTYSIGAINKALTEYWEELGF